MQYDVIEWHSAHIELSSKTGSASLHPLKLPKKCLDKIIDKLKHISFLSLSKHSDPIMIGWRDHYTHSFKVTVYHNATKYATFSYKNPHDKIQTTYFLYKKHFKEFIQQLEKANACR